MNKRIEELEFMPVWDHAAMLDMQERMDGLEKSMEAKFRDLRSMQQQLRSEIVQLLEPLPADVDVKKPTGTMRSIWKYLWGN
jgi:general secretion pathway protein A